MMNPEDQLQEHLIRLENGEPIEAHLADLPVDEAQLLRVAAALRSVAYPQQSAASPRSGHNCCKPLRVAVPRLDWFQRRRNLQCWHDGHR